MAWSREAGREQLYLLALRYREGDEETESDELVAQDEDDGVEERRRWELGANLVCVTSCRHLGNLPDFLSVNPALRSIEDAGTGAETGHQLLSNGFYARHAIPMSPQRPRHLLFGRLCPCWSVPTASSFSRQNEVEAKPNSPDSVLADDGMKGPEAGYALYHESPAWLEQQ
uniref:Uncharacterized protein n=1 Tax=Mycena chlorophos TaxID=658473 RepID=A0ABQ0KX85_MYCCL|nr:predicted protein [Mycena chlorophos]